MIGLSSGSWATVLARHPGLERLTVIEINPGYLQLLPHYPEVAGLLKHPKVQVEIMAEDHEVDGIVDAIMKAARTGKIGDGKVFVLPADQVYRIRTGEMGPDAV